MVDNSYLVVVFDENGVLLLEEDGLIVFIDDCDVIGVVMMFDVVFFSEFVVIVGDFDFVDEEVEYEKVEIVMFVCVFMIGSFLVFEFDKLECIFSVWFVCIVLVLVFKGFFGFCLVFIEVVCLVFFIGSNDKVSFVIVEGCFVFFEVWIVFFIKLKVVLER